MSAIKLASRYAKSLLDFSVEHGTLDAVHKDQLYLQQVLKASKEFSLLLGNPLIHADRKVKVLQSVLSGKVSEITMKFLQLLVKKSREVYLKEMADSFILQYDAYQKVTPVKITSAAPLEKGEIDKLLSKLKQQANLENIKLTTEVDESLIGGFVLQYGDKQYDASVAKHLGVARKGLSDNVYMKKLR